MWQFFVMPRTKDISSFARTVVVVGERETEAEGCGTLSFDRACRVVAGKGREKLLYYLEIILLCIDYIILLCIDYILLSF
jgi:hypothetical protein